MQKAGTCGLLFLVAALLLAGVAEGYTAFHFDDDFLDNSYEDRYVDDNSFEDLYSLEDPRSRENFHSWEDLYSNEHDNSLEHYGTKVHVYGNQGVPAQVTSQNGGRRYRPWGSIEDGTGGHLVVSTGVGPVQPVGGKVFGDNSRESSESFFGGWLQQEWITNLRQLVNEYKAVILNFGDVIQEGALYFLRRFQHSADQVRESLVFEKLEQKLKEGHAEVAKFFQILGEEIRAWREKKIHTDVVRPPSVLIEEQDTQDLEDMSDVLQDDKVIVQLNKLKETGVLTDDDVQILTQKHTTQKSFF